MLIMTNDVSESDLELVELRIKIQFLSVCTPDFFCGHDKIETCLVTEHEHEHEPKYEGGGQERGETGRGGVGALVYC